jgi:hypothetical protein
MLLTLNNVEAANNYVFSSFGAGGQFPAITGKMFGVLRVPAGDGSTRNNAYSNFQSASGVHETGIDFAQIGNTFGVGFGQDAGSGYPFSGNFMMRTYTNAGWICDQSSDNSGLYGMNHYTSTRCTLPPTGQTYQLGPSMAKFYAPLQGAAIASASTIAPTNGVFHVTGTAAIDTITPPATCITGTACQITIIPDGIFTTTIAGNIALASTAVVNRTLTLTYDATTTKWYPSY